MAIGYDERMGTLASNEVLSPQRIDAVKAYLVGKAVASNRVQISAKGETQPTSFTGECREANNATNVACRQPDRHVFIEIAETRIAS